MPRNTTTRPVERPSAERQLVDQPRSLAQEGGGNAQQPEAAAEVKRGTESPGQRRAFYQLYLSSSSGSRPAEAGETIVHLKNASGRSCAWLMEMLYVPMGRSGSADETYLMYEERDEFDAASRFAAVLDVASSSDGASNSSSFNDGVARLLAILESGAVVDPDLVTSCEKALLAALEDESLSKKQRWAAGVFLGRVVSDYRYDYPAARTHLTSAAKQMPADSLEKMTAMLWVTDAFAQEGKFEDADRFAKMLIDSYKDRWPRSRTIERARAVLKESK